MRLVVNATAYGDPPGGAGLRARHLFGALRDHDLLFLVAEDTPASVVPAGAETRRLPVRAARPFDRWLRLSLPREGDLLFTDHYPAGPIPTVITLHDTGKNRIRRHLIARHARHAAGAIAVSETVARFWRELGVESQVLPNGVDMRAMRAVSAPAGEHLLFCDPALAHKGADVARKVACQLEVELREVGRGAAWLEQPALWRAIAEAGAVLCPARDEGFGMVPLEALALGRPVVASDIPAHREVLGNHAFYAPPGDVDAWCAAARAALACPADRLERGRARAETFSWERAARALEEVIAVFR